MRLLCAGRYSSHKTNSKRSEGYVVFMNIFEELTQILSRQLRVDVEKIDKSADIMEDLGADSLDIVEILMTVEEQFGIAIPEEEFPNLRTVGDLCDYIENNA